MRTHHLASLILLGCLSGALAPSEAATIRVPGDYQDLRLAVSEASAGDVIQIAGNGGATYPSHNLTIDKDLTLQGGWRIDFAVRDPDVYVSVLRDTTTAPDRPVVRILGSVNVVIDGLWILDGWGGILAEDGANLTVRDCLIRGQRRNRSGEPDVNELGTGMRVRGGNLLVERTVFQANRSEYGGAALGLLQVNSAEIVDCRIEDALASGSAISVDDKSGAGIHARDVSSLSLTRVSFENCRSVHRGGGVYALRSSVTLTDCEMLDGLGSSGGGGIYVDHCPNVTLRDCTIERNTSSASGGLHVVNSGLVTVSGTRFAHNLSLEEAGAILLLETPFAITGCEFEENYRQAPLSLSNRGGAVLALDSSGSVTNSSFRGERVNDRGGAWAQIGGQVTFSGCRFEDCQAATFGGALHIELSGRIDLAHTLVANCRARFGGGVSATLSADIGLDHCTFVGGAGISAGAAIYLDTGSTVEVVDSILCCATQGDLAFCGEGAILVDHSNAWNDDLVNPRGEYGGECDDPTGTAGNLRTDPVLCPDDPDYAIASGSPCEGAASDGTDMGWKPVACAAPSPVSLEPSSWGRLKAAYRAP